MNARADIDLVLPCYNPPSGWEERVATHFREVERLFSPVRFHLFIVSDGSRRGYEPETIDRLRQLIPNVCVVDYKPNRGKGYALREAVKRCTSPYIIYTDYDFPYTNDSFGRMVETLLGGADVVVATRSKSYQENLPPFRKVLSKLSHICNTWILRIKIKDTQGGKLPRMERGRLFPDLFPSVGVYLLERPERAKVAVYHDQPFRLRHGKKAGRLDPFLQG